MSKNQGFDPITLFSLIGKLKKIPRTGWLSHGLINVESIAEHSFCVSTMAYMLAPSLNCDINKITQMALIHDLSEILTGDIVYEHGYLVDEKLKKIKHMNEKEAIKKISSLIGHGKKMYDLWIEYEEQNSKEAIILKQLDKLEMAQQALDYENPRNPNHLREFWENAKKHIDHPVILNLFKELCKRRTPPYNNYDLIGKRFL